jgi:pimeloyl-ACP methyl ester carboxylesterase
MYICVSGRGRPAADWDAVGRRLSARGDVLPLDLRSGAADLCRIARDRRPGRTTLVGHSMGAVVAMEAAAGQPGLFAGLVMTDGFYPPARGGRTLAATVADYGRHRALFAVGAPSRWRQRETRVAAPRMRSLMAMGLWPASFHRLADRVSCPVLMVHGTHDHHVPAAFAVAAQARHPSWELRLIKAGHFPHRDAPDAWLGAVEAWLG